MVEVSYEHGRNNDPFAPWFAQDDRCTTHVHSSSSGHNSLTLGSWIPSPPASWSGGETHSWYKKDSIESPLLWSCCMHTPLVVANHTSHSAHSYSIDEDIAPVSG